MSWKESEDGLINGCRGERARGRNWDWGFERGHVAWVPRPCGICGLSLVFGFWVKKFSTDRVKLENRSGADSFDISFVTSVTSV
jgi:hypothetical protein